MRRRWIPGLVLLAVAACGGPAPATGGPVESPAASTGAPSTSVVASEPPPSAALPTTTNTDWGTIWDELPPSFPVYPGSIPTETRSGPLSAELAVPTDPASAAAWYRGWLEAAGYVTQGLSDPLEDGSIVVDWAGRAPGCRVEISLTPLSGTTAARILFGADCPFA
jgi:hypothetical protein